MDDEHRTERARFLIRRAFNEWNGEGTFADLIADEMVSYAKEVHASLVKTEQEACAKIADGLHDQMRAVVDQPGISAETLGMTIPALQSLQYVAEAIRKRKPVEI